MKPVENGSDPVWKQLERILASPGFSHNERLSSFLRFVILQKLEGKAGQLKETVIGAEVFGRDPSYDPRTDSVVRTEAAKLRSRLAEYYATDGSRDPIRIEIPKGAYIPQWEEPRKAGDAPRWKLAAAIALALLLVIAGTVTWRIHLARRQTIAVLPFVNLSADVENEYFSDGLTEEIIQSLSVVEGLEVTSQSSSFDLKGTRLATREVGGKLHVNTLLRGSVRKQDERLRITAELVSAADGKQIWSSTYDREMRDVLNLQQEIAGSIASALRLKLGAGQKRYTDNAEAYQLYLRGRYSLEGRGERSRQALQYFEQAIALDANYALAYAGAADALLAMDRDHRLPHEEAQSRARVAAEKALQLDAMLSEAYTALAKIRATEYAWRDAERVFRHAIELNTNSAAAHLELGYSVLIPQRRFDEGLAEMRRSLVLDPLSSSTNVLLAHALLLGGRYRAAEDESRKTIVLDQARIEAYLFLGQALYWQGKYAEALAAMQEADRRSPGGQADGWLACADVHAGLRDQALGILQDNLPGGKRTRVPNRRLLPIYACLGDNDHAMESLEKMYAEREPLLSVYLLYPELAPMRSDSRFVALRQRINLQP